LLIIGIDAACFDVLDPYLEGGRLPALAGIAERGVRAVLRSTVPPLTPAAWSTILTGVNPGKHGVIDFAQWDRASGQLVLTRGGSRLYPTVFELLSKRDRTTGLYNVPYTYPPPPINGFVVSGLDAPSWRGHVHPASEEKKMLAKFSVAALDPSLYIGNIDGYDVGRVDAEVHRKTDAFIYLCEKYTPDAAFISYQQLDVVQHFFWHSRSIRAKISRPTTELFDHVLAEIDSAVARLLGIWGEEANIFVLSDHGAAQCDYYFDPNRFLVERGLCVLEDAARTPRRRLVPRLWASLPARVRNAVRRAVGRRAVGVKLREALHGHGSHPTLDAIVWERTRAFSCGRAAVVHINQSGRDPHGIVPPQHVDGLLDEIADALLELRTPDTDSPVFGADGVFKREELYEGESLQRMPDLVAVPAQDRVAILPHDLPGHALAAPGYGEGLWEAGHTLQGLFMAAGPDFRSGELPEASVCDIAPTMLYALDEAVPEYMDGAVLEAAFRPELLARRPVQYSEEPPALRGETGADAYTAAERERVEERLKSLGYMG